MRTSRKHSSDRSKKLAKEAICQAVQTIEVLESRLLFTGTAAATVILTPSTNSYTIGNNGVTLVVDVSGTAGPSPMGQVAFFDGATLISSVPATLTGGVATFVATDSELHSGSNNITADYEGDGTYAASNSNVAVVNVTGSGTTTVNPLTTLTSSTNPASVGTNVTFSVNIAPAVSGGPTPQGSVTFFDENNNQIGTVQTLDSSGNASVSTSSLAVGPDNITATYSGDSNYNGINTAPLTETITSSTGTTPSNTALSDGGAPSSITSGTSITFTANVTPTGTDGGTVQFMIGGTALGSPQNVVGGVASLTTTTLPVGSDVITAVYGGNTTFAGSTSSSITETVTPGALTPTTITVTSGTPTSTAGTPVTFTATVSPIPTGAPSTVQFFSNNNPIGAPQTVMSDGTAQLSISTLGLGTDNITATFSGNSTFASSTTTAPFVETVNAAIAPTTTTLTFTPMAPAVGNLVNLTATVSPGNATGTVQFFDGTTLLGSATLSGGNASLSVASLVVGSHSLTASYGGDAGDSPSTSAVVMLSEVQGTAVLTTASSAPTIALGDSVTFTATVAPVAVGGPTPTGTVSFFDGTTALGTAINLSNGVATFLASGLTVGSHNITFTYSGDTNYVMGTSSAIIETVGTGPTVTTLTTSPNPILFGQVVTLTATVSPNLATGTVTFFDGTTQLGMPAPITAGVASITVTSLPTGTDSLTAVYSGDANYSTSISTAVTETVNRAPSTTVLTTDVSTAVFGDTVNLTANVPITGATGTVSFFNGATLLGTSTLFGGVATLATSTLPVGADTLTAVYSGDATYLSSTSSPVVVAMTQGTTTTTLDANPSVVALGAPVTFTITVGSDNPNTLTPTGTVSLVEDGTTVLATSIVLINGTATFTTTTLPLGVDTIVANYSGDGNYLASVSTVTNVGVSAVTTTTSTTSLTSSAPTSNYGDAVTFTAVVAPALTSTFTPTGTVTFFDGIIALGAPVALVNGVAFFTTSSLPPGLNSVTAVYNGDANFTTSTSAPVNQTVTGGNNTGVYVTTLDVSAFNAAFGSPVKLTANVFPSSSSTPPPFGGTVTFFAGSQTLGAATLASNGFATFLTPLPAGTDEITAAYNGGGPITASLPRMVAISSPATPSLAKANLPPAIVVGTSFHTNLPITVTNLGASQLKGLFTIQVYLDTAPTLDGNRTLLTTMARSFSLSGHKSKAFRAGETLQSSLPAGTYYLLVDVTDPNGLTNLTASTPIVIAAPFVGLKASVSATNPPKIGIGQSAAVFVTVTNTGNEAASGLLSLTLSPSTDGVNPVVGKILGTGSITTTIMPGKSRRFRVVLDTTALATGSYFPYITAALDGISTTAVGITPFTVG